MRLDAAVGHSSNLVFCTRWLSYERYSSSRAYRSAGRTPDPAFGWRIHAVSALSLSFSISATLAESTVTLPWGKQMRLLDVLA
jgi:hypothetical protein